MGDILTLILLEADKNSSLNRHSRGPKEIQDSAMSKLVKRKAEFRFKIVTSI